MLLAVKMIYGPIEWNWEYRNKPECNWFFFSFFFFDMTECRDFSGERIKSSTGYSGTIESNPYAYTTQNSKCMCVLNLRTGLWWCLPVILVPQDGDVDVSVEDS